MLSSVELAGPSVATILAFRRRRITPLDWSFAVAFTLNKGGDRSQGMRLAAISAGSDFGNLDRRLARGMGVDGVDPVHRLGPFDRLDVEIDDHRFLVAAHEHAFERFARTRIDFLMR